jgi:hypothetical protein
MLSGITKEIFRDDVPFIKAEKERKKKKFAFGAKNALNVCKMTFEYLFE